MKTKTGMYQRMVERGVNIHGPPLEEKDNRFGFDRGIRTLDLWVLRTTPASTAWVSSWWSGLSLFPRPAKTTIWVPAIKNLLKKTSFYSYACLSSCAISKRLMASTSLVRGYRSVPPYTTKLLTGWISANAW